jgi:hypothetical protein
MDNIKMDLRGIKCGAGLIDLAEDRKQRTALVNTMINLQVPQRPGRFLSCYTTGSLSRRGQLYGVSYLVFKNFRSYRQVHVT